MVRSVFFSYASYDAGWVHQFRGDRYFVRPLGDGLRITDYMIAGHELAFGPLDEWLKAKVEECVAIFAFMSEPYLKSRASNIEFTKALDRMLAKKILFVPVMLDVAGKTYWNSLKANEKYKEILAGYMYADFTYQGMPVPIYSRGIENIDVTQKIYSLAETVAATLELRSKVEPPPPTGQSNLVLLGDPRFATPGEDFSSSLEDLSQRLSCKGIDHKRWPHAWRTLKAKPDEKVRAPADFLRIVSSLDAEDEAEQPQTMKWIEKCGRVDGAGGRVILWNPWDEKIDWELEEPQLRQETAEALARWLADRFGLGDSSDPDGPGPDPLLLVIDDPQYEAFEDAPYSDVVRMVCELTNRKFRGNSMTAEEFNRFIVTNQDRKLIIAVLDNNVNMTVQDGSGPLERFEQIVERWQEEIGEINSEKDFEVEVVWVAVMARLAHLNPLSTWNKRTLEPIHVLRVFRKKGETGRPSFEPDEASAVRVAAALKRLVENRPEPAPAS